MEEIRKSNHKNYLPSYPFSTEEIIEKYILFNPKNSFKLFAEKIEKDAKKDWERGRKFLETQGLKAAEICKKISELSENSEAKGEENSQLIEEIINMDYQSVVDFFQLLKSYFQENEEVYQNLSSIVKSFQEMRKVSEKHTNIINKELIQTLNS